MTPDEVQVRLDICEGCAEECEEHRAGRIVHGDPCAACPRRIWHAHGDCQPGVEVEIVEPGLGLGDVVAAVAQPIARTVDAITGGRTDLEHCGGCAARKKRWNRFRIG